eukprot:8618024-Pyramimonas_sp.AAC.1
MPMLPSVNEMKPYPWGSGGASRAHSQSVRIYHEYKQSIYCSHVIINENKCDCLVIWGGCPSHRWK